MIIYSQYEVTGWLGLGNQMKHTLANSPRVQKVLLPYVCLHFKKKLLCSVEVKSETVGFQAAGSTLLSFWMDRSQQGHPLQ